MSDVCVPLSSPPGTWHGICQPLFVKSAETIDEPHDMKLQKKQNENTEMMTSLEG